MSKSQAPSYNQGYEQAITRSHATRTAEVEGAFILPHLRQDFKILDLGCGPGSISTSFAKYVPEGSVTGIDLAEKVLDQAREHISNLDPRPRNVNFEYGNVLEGLKYDDASFDVVFTSQVLVHIPEPVKALREMRRVLKPGGFIACRETDLPLRWYPYLPGCQLQDRYLYYLTIRKSSSLNPTSPPFGEGHRGGSYMHAFAREAGFDPSKMKKGAGTQVYGTAEETRWWGQHMAGRVENEEYKGKLKAVGATEEEIGTMVKDLKAWGEDVDAWFAILHAELICWV